MSRFGRSREWASASTVRREASVMNSLYKDSRSRSFHSELARMICVRCVIQVVAMEAVAPTKEPSAAAIAVTTVEFIVAPVLTQPDILPPCQRVDANGQD